jgi:L,D-peptidoglycan transpeptidase YkuD (ErfK/YbiS/YcfS/YnhG family)
MSLEITEVKIVDTMNERAKTCTLTLAPPDSDRGPRPAAEVHHPGDTQSIVATNIRPNNNLIEVEAAFGGLPQHKIFAGVVEGMDDLEDADKDLFTIDLSATPTNQGHRERVNILHNSTVPTSFSDSKPTGLDHWSSTDLLNLVCQKAGIKFGRNDLPEHTIWGTFEIIRKNPMEVAEELCAPFNIFDFQRLFVRCDETNGLQIIKIDYTKGAGVTNPYPITSLEQKSRSYGRYMPENRVGNNDIVCRGADIYGPYATMSSVVNEANKTGSSRQGKTVRRIAKHTYRGGSNMDAYNAYDTKGSSPTDMGDSKTETESVVAYVCTVTMRPEVDDGPVTYYTPEGVSTTSDTPGAVGVTNPYYDPNITDDGSDDESLGLISNPPRDIDTLIASLASGRYTNISISGQYVLSSKTTVTMNDGAGKHITETSTNSRYAVQQFSKLTYKNNSDADVVLVGDESVTLVTIDIKTGQMGPQGKTVRSYSYSAFGIQAAMTTKTYLYDPRDSWVLLNINTEYPDGSATTSAEISYFADKNANDIATRQQSWQTAYDTATARGMDETAATEYADNQLASTTTIGVDGGTGFGNSAEDNRTPLGRYTLLNGYPINISSGGNISTQSAAIQYELRPTNQATYSSLQQAMKHLWYNAELKRQTQVNNEDKLKGAFEINVPYMDYSGLTLLWNLAQRQKELEQNNAYWEIVKGTGPIDTTPAAGASVSVDGSGGIAEAVTHIITDDDAMTTVELRRLVW